RVGVAADRGERKRVGGRAVEDKVHVAVGVERAPDRVGRGTRPVVGAIPGRVAGVRRFERAPGFRTDTRIVVARELRRVWPPHACGCRRCAAPGGGAIRGSGRPFAAHGPPTLAAVAAALPPVGGFADRGGPSPLMARVPSQPLLDEATHRLQRLRQRRWIRAAGLRHVGAAATLAADLFRDVIDELARLHLAGEVVRHAGDQRHASIRYAGEHDRGALQLVLQLVDRLAQRRSVAAVERGGDDFRTLDVDRAAGEIIARACRRFRLEPRELTLGRPRALLQLRDPRLELGDRRFQNLRCAGEFRFLLLNVLERAFAGDGLDAANPRRDAAFRNDLEEPDVAGARNVRAAAQLARAADVEDADLVAVFFAEEHHGAVLLRPRDRHRARGNRCVVEDFRIDDCLDAPDLLVGERRTVREVEARLVGIDERSLLLPVCAQYLAQRLVHQVRRRVVAHRASARFVVDARRNGVAFAQLARFHLADMAGHIGLDLLRVLDGKEREARAALRQLATIAYLPAGLCIERRA